jgi:uncharacterized protein YbjT (DUF2867 family)
LVFGATGHIGSQVLLQLAPTGALVRAFVRNPNAIRASANLEIVRGDLSSPETVRDVCDGVTTAFLLWPFPTAAHCAPAVVRALGEAVDHIVFVSSLIVRDGVDQQAEPIAQFHADVEQLIENSSAKWTFLRPGGFATNTLAWARQIRKDGVVRWPSAEAARSLIHEADIAAVAVRAMTGGIHYGQKYLLTGPGTVTQRKQVEIIGDVIGRQVRFEELSRETARRQLIDSGWPPNLADEALEDWAKMAIVPEPVTETVEKITGRAAKSYREWVVDHVADFR